MRTLVVFSLAFAVFGAGCKHPGSTKLEGRWKGQRAEGVPSDVQLEADVFALGTEIMAREDRITISTPAGKNVTATYFVDKEDPAILVLHTDKDATSETFTFRDPKTLVWKVDDKRSIVFAKAD